MKSNMINYYKNVLKNIQNPKGNDAREREINKAKAVRNKFNLEERFKTARKYKDDPEIKELLGEKKEKETKSKEKK